MTSLPFKPNNTSLPLPAGEHVGPVQRLVRGSAALNGRVVLPVIVESDEELRPLAAFDQRCLRRVRGGQERADERRAQTGGNAEYSDT